MEQHFVDSLIPELGCQLTVPEVIPEKISGCVVLHRTCD